MLAVQKWFQIKLGFTCLWKWSLPNQPGGASFQSKLHRLRKSRGVTNEISAAMQPSVAADQSTISESFLIKFSYTILTHVLGKGNFFPISYSELFGVWSLPAQLNSSAVWDMSVMCAALSCCLKSAAQYVTLYVSD